MGFPPFRLINVFVSHPLCELDRSSVALVIDPVVRAVTAGNCKQPKFAGAGPASKVLEHLVAVCAGQPLALTHKSSAMFVKSHAVRLTTSPYRGFMELRPRMPRSRRILCVIHCPVGFGAREGGSGRRTVLRLAAFRLHQSSVTPAGAMSWVSRGWCRATSIACAGSSGGEGKGMVVLPTLGGRDSHADAINDRGQPSKNRIYADFSFDRASALRHNGPLIGTDRRRHPRPRRVYFVVPTPRRTRHSGVFSPIGTPPCASPSRRCQAIGEGAKDDDQLVRSPLGFDPR